MACGVYTILLSAVVALLLAGYLGQKYLPPPKPKVLGIDLGTTYSCIGAYHAVSGQVDIFSDADGHKCIPSIVTFLDNGDTLIGYEALSVKQRNPAHTVYDAKRFIGKEFTQEELNVEQQRYPFKMHLTDDRHVRFLITHNINSTPSERLVSPEEVGGLILGRLRQTAETQLGGQRVSRVVMSVPAEFDERQRNATRAAARLAGMEVLRVINEPTAAALAYGLHTREGVNAVIVVDLGGGTLDVSLLDIQGGMFLTRAMAGNNHLGGQDFNDRLFHHLSTELASQYSNSTFNPLDDLNVAQSLRDFVESIKLNLTEHESYSVALDLEFHPQPFIRTISRSMFEHLNADLFKKILEPIDRVMLDAELRPIDIDSIVLVGGSTRVPRVRDMMREYFGQAPDVSVEPELAVVVGVSVQAGIIGGAWPLAVSAIEVQTAAQKIRL